MYFFLTAPKLYEDEGCQTDFGDTIPKADGEWMDGWLEYLGSYLRVECLTGFRARLEKTKTNQQS